MIKSTLFICFFAIHTFSTDLSNNVPFPSHIPGKGEELKIQVSITIDKSEADVANYIAAIATVAKVDEIRVMYSHSKKYSSLNLTRTRRTKWGYYNSPYINN
jgi:hypothetical protein